MATRTTEKTLFDDGKTIEHDPTIRTRGGTPKRTETKAKTAVAIVERPAPAPTNLLAVIASAASNKRVDVQKMRELLTMQREVERDQQEREFNIAMHAAQSKMPRIARDKQADRFKYATLENVSRQIDPIAREHGFVLSYGNSKTATPGNIAIYVDVMHVGGCVRRYESPELKPDDRGLKGEPNKTSTQGSGASISYMRRYLKLMVFDVVIDGEDIDGRKSKPAKEPLPVITPEEAERLVDLCGAAECPRDKLIQHLNGEHPREPRITSLEDLPKAWFNEAVTAVANYEARRKARAAAKNDRGAEA